MLRRRKRTNRKLPQYLFFSILAIAFNQAYLAAGGAYAPELARLYLYPLAGGGLAYTILYYHIPGLGDTRYYPLFSNLHAMGLFFFAAGDLVKGLWDTPSLVPRLFKIAGLFFLVEAGIILSQILRIKRRGRGEKEPRRSSSPAHTAGRRKSAPTRQPRL